MAGEEKDMEVGAKTLVPQIPRDGQTVSESDSHTWHGFLSHINSNMYEIEGEVRGGGDGMSRMALVLSGITSHSNSSDNEFKGKVGKGGDGRPRMPLASAGPTSLCKGSNNVMAKSGAGVMAYLDGIGIFGP